MVVNLESTTSLLNLQDDNFLESTRKRNRQSLNFINLKIELPLKAIIRLNSKKKAYGIQENTLNSNLTKQH